MECRHCGSFISTMFANTCGPGTPCAERQWKRLVHRKQAEIDHLQAIVTDFGYLLSDEISNDEAHRRLAKMRAEPNAQTNPAP